MLLYVLLGCTKHASGVIMSEYQFLHIVEIEKNNSVFMLDHTYMHWEYKTYRWYDSKAV